MRYRVQFIKIVVVLGTLATPAIAQRTGGNPRLLTDDLAPRVLSSDSVPAGLRRPRVPRPSVAGTFEVREEIVGWSGRVLGSNLGYLFATADVGLLVLAAELDDNRLAKTHVYRAQRWSTDSTGDVVLSAGLTYDGYQTDDGGFVAEATIRDGSGSRRAWLGGVPARLPSSRNDGLFAATSRTFYEENGRRISGSEPTDWSGDMAIAFSGGVMHVDLALRNSSGGTTTFFAAGPAGGDTFDLRDSRGSRLVGTMRDGVLTAEWTDKRTGKTAFVGQLKAERR